MDSWSGWATQTPGRMPVLYGAKEIAELNWYPEEGQRLIFLKEAKPPSGYRGVAGGKKGGPTRARKLSPERRSEIAKMGAKARWAPKP